METPASITASVKNSTIDIFLGDGFDIWLHSYFLTGLIQLANDDEITLRVLRGSDARLCSKIQDSGYPLLLLRCHNASGKDARFICFDPRDQSDAWQPLALEGCDLYFKRSTYPPDTQQLPPTQQNKVRAINPMFATWQSSLAWSVRTYVAFVRSALREIAAHAPARQTLHSFVRLCHNFTSLSSLSQYEAPPGEHKRPQVLFQTRLWDPATENGDWVGPCNQARVAMVRELRSQLGDRLVGGLIRTPYTEEHHPELLSNLTPTATSKRPEFIRLCRQFLVRVNIKALFDAIPYSLGETLAANNCLVSETIRNTCATPLIEGRHYLGFKTPQECADRCMELLDSPEKANLLRKEANDYYRNAVNPKAAMKMFIAKALALQIC
jgi:hypothetical protein